MEMVYKAKEQLNELKDAQYFAGFFLNLSRLVSL